MAFTPNYAHDTDLLSKIKVGGVTKYLKDADLRTIVEGFNEDIVKGSIGNITDENQFVYSQDIKEYVDAAVAGVHAFSYQVEAELPTATEETMYIIYLISEQGTISGTYAEYITLDKGSSYDPQYVWEKIGTTDVDLSGYLTDVSYANGTLSQTKGGVTTTVHEFGDLADADTASGEYIKATGTGTVTINTYNIVGGQTSTATVGTDIAYVDGFTGTTAFNTNAIDSASLAVDTAETPTFKIVSEAINGATLTGDQTFAKSGIASASLTSDEESAEGKIVYVTAAGTVSLTGTTTFLTSLGTASTASFATAGITAAMDQTDTEMLVFTVAGTADAVIGYNTPTSGTVGIDKADDEVEYLGITTTAATTGSVGISVTAATATGIKVATTAATTSSFDVTTKHIHYTPDTTVADVTVATVTATVTVSPVSE